MSANKFIIPLSAVLLTAGLVALPESAFAQKCTKAQRKQAPACLSFKYENYLTKRKWFNSKRGSFANQWVKRYKVKNRCGRTLKLHEDISNGGDRGYKIAHRETVERALSGTWDGLKAYRKVECCVVQTSADFRYTCGERDD